MLNNKIEIHTIDNKIITGILKEVNIETDGTITRKVEVTSDGNMKDKVIEINDKEIYIIANIE